MYKAFFDESGTLKARGFVAIAGFVAPEAKWADFDLAWMAALAKHGAPYLHTTDLANFKKVYKDWTANRRDALMADLLEVIHATPRIAAIGAVMAVDDFNSLTKDQQSKLRNPLFPLFQTTIRAAALQPLFEPPDVKVRMTYSNQEEFGPSMRQIWNLMAKTIDVRGRMDSLTFADMRHVPGLQAADLLAFELRRHYHNLRTRPDIRMRMALARILIQQRAYGHSFIRFLPRWYLRLQLAPPWVYRPLTAVLAFLVGLAARFQPRIFYRVMLAPRFSPEVEKAIQRWEAED